ncbi:uncharacterized protein LOC119767030 isoform X1 [Culex quinquefasciatus]|uniref:uncharacterized protein LOC119767030 isoform X1 n=1 Tax=Culex quinquefasciatus TaxID=7176 RepID=UPI0018E3C37E|nr:uncharacterized protein LOC119767030 isoform X1 [Culex quinquefasciatus]
MSFQKLSDAWKELTREIHPSNSEKEVNSSNNGKKQQECNKYIYSRWMVFLVLMSSIAVTLYFHNGKHNSPVKNNSAEFLVPPNPQRTDTKPVPSYTQLHIFKQAAVCSDSQVCSQVGRTTPRGCPGRRAATPAAIGVQAAGTRTCG